MNDQQMESWEESIRSGGFDAFDDLVDEMGGMSVGGANVDELANFLERLNLTAEEKNLHFRVKSIDVVRDQRGHHHAHILLSLPLGTKENVFTRNNGTEGMQFAYESLVAYIEKLGGRPEIYFPQPQVYAPFNPYKSQDPGSSWERIYNIAPFKPTMSQDGNSSLERIYNIASF